MPHAKKPAKKRGKLAYWTGAVLDAPKQPVGLAPGEWACQEAEATIAGRHKKIDGLKKELLGNPEILE